MTGRFSHPLGGASSKGHLQDRQILLLRETNHDFQDCGFAHAGAAGHNAECVLEWQEDCCALLLVQGKALVRFDLMHNARSPVVWGHDGKQRVLLRRLP